MGTTTAKGVPIPGLDDAPNGPDAISDVAGWVDARPGIALLTYAQINALSGVEIWTGRCVYQTDGGTNRPQAGPYWYNGVAWRLPWNQPWGWIDEILPASFGTSSGSLVPITGGSLTKTFVDHRTFRIRASAKGSSATSGDIGEVSVEDDVDGQLGIIRVSADHSTSVADGDSVEIFKTYAAGSHTVTLKARVASGSGLFTFSGLSLSLIDFGPAGAPA